MKLRVACFGDSITTGTLVCHHRTWVNMLSQRLNAELLINAMGINGNTTRMALERINIDIQKQEYDIVIVQFGLNDCNLWDTDKGLSRVSINSFKENLNEILNRCYHFKVKKVLLCTNHRTNKSKIYDISSSEYNNAIRSVCNEWTNAILVDHETLIGEEEGIILPDGIHLSEKGHKRYYQNLLGILQRLCREYYI